MPNYIGDMLNAYDTQYQNRQNRQMNDMKIQQAQGEASQRAQQMEDEKLMRANAKKSWRETPMLVGLHDMLLNELDPTDTAGKQKLDSFWTDNRTAETIGQLLPIHQKDMENHIKKNQMVQAPVFENGQYVNKPMPAWSVPTSNLNQDLAFQKYKDEQPTNTFTIHPETGAMENTKVPASMAKSIDMQNDINLFLYKAKIQNDNANQILQAKNEVLNTPQQFELPDGTLSPMMTLSAFKTWLPSWGKQKTIETKQESLVPLTLDDGTVLPVSPQFYADYMQKKQTGTGKGSSRSGGGDDNPPTITIQENGVWKTIANPNYKPPTQALPVVTTQTPEVNPVVNVNYDMPNPDMNRIGTSTEDDAFVYSTSPQRPVEVNNVLPATVTPANVPNPTAITQPTLGAVQGMGSVKEQTDTIGVAGNQAYLKNPAIAKINPTESLRLLMDKDPVLKERYNQYSSLPETQGLPDDYVAVPVLLGGLTSFEIIPRKDKTLITNMIKEWNDNRKIPIYKNGKVVRYGQYSPAELRQKQIDEGKASANTLAFNRDMIKLKEVNKGRIALKGTPSYSDLHPAKPASAKPVKDEKDTINNSYTDYKTFDMLNDTLEKSGLGLRGRIAFKILNSMENGYSSGNVAQGLITKTIPADILKIYETSNENINDVLGETWVKGSLLGNSKAEKLTKDFAKKVNTAASWAKLAKQAGIKGEDLNGFINFYDTNFK